MKITTRIMAALLGLAYTSPDLPRLVEPPLPRSRRQGKRPAARRYNGFLHQGNPPGTKLARKASEGKLGKGIHA